MSRKNVVLNAWPMNSLVVVLHWSGRSTVSLISYQAFEDW